MIETLKLIRYRAKRDPERVPTLLEPQVQHCVPNSTTHQTMALHNVFTEKIIIMRNLSHPGAFFFPSKDWNRIRALSSIQKALDDVEI